MFPYIIFFNCILGIVITLLWSFHFGNWRKHSALITVAYSASCILTSFLILNLPIDIVSSFYDFCARNSTNITNCEKPILYVDSNVLRHFYSVVYWTLFIFTSFLLPFLKSYIQSGNFTILGRIKRAILDNFIYYGLFLTLAIILLIYLATNKAIKLEPSNLKTLIITTSNTWGLFMLICFLGYGLVNFPRSLWHKSNPNNTLRVTCFKISRLNLDKTNDERVFLGVISKINHLKTNMPSDEKLIKYAHLILENLHKYNHLLDPTEIVEPTNFKIDKNELEKLNMQLAKSGNKYDRTLSLMKDAISKASYYQDVTINSIINGATSLAESNTIKESEKKVFRKFTKANYIWHCVVVLKVYQVLAILSAFASVLVIWSECLFFIRSPKLSIPAILFYTMLQYGKTTLIALTTFLTMGYIGICVLYSVYHLKIYGYYRLLRNHLSDQVSLLFCATLLTRLIPALCLNMLGLAHLDFQNKNISSPETAYTKFMGHLEVVPFIAKGFNIYFPIIIIFLCLIAYFELGARILRLIGIPQFIKNANDINNSKELSEVDQDILDCIEDGRITLNQARRDDKLKSNQTL